MGDLKRDELLDALRLLRSRFERDGVTHMALFGSRARRDNRPDSDVDIMIDVAENGRFSILDVVGIGHIIEDELGLQASVVMRRSIDDEFAGETSADLIEVF